MIEPVVGPGLDEGCPIEELLGPLTSQEKTKVPERLYCGGDRDLLHRDRDRVAIVGSRRASPQGRRRAAQLARDLVAHNVVIVSGLAAGIDTAAHEAAIEHNGRTIAVLGTSLDPLDNQRREEIAWAPLSLALAGVRTMSRGFGSEMKQPVVGTITLDGVRPVRSP